MAPHSSSGPQRLSVVVLPFANLSDDPDQHYFADGITEDLTTDLSRIPEERGVVPFVKVDKGKVPFYGRSGLRARNN
jgi:TolB-like protein